jgi:hypothetical protein
MRPTLALPLLLAMALSAVAAACGDILRLGDPPAHIGEDRTDATVARPEVGGDAADVTVADAESGAAERAEPLESDVHVDAPVAPEGGQGDADAMVDATNDREDGADAAPDGDAGDAPSTNPLGDLIGAADSNPMGYVRSDGTSMVVYRSAVGDVVEIESSGSQWSPPRDLSRLAGATTTILGDAFGYVRSDGTNDVVYRGADDDIHHIELGASGWKDSNLSQTAGAPRGVASGDPSPFVRSDAVSAVAYRTADDHIHELALVSGSWTDVDLSRGVAAPPAASDPGSFARGDGVDSVVYRAQDQDIYEISTPMDGGANGLTDLTQATPSPCAAASGKPHPYLRSDGVPSVTYRNGQATIATLWELALISGMWGCYDLIYNSDNPGLVASGGDPSPYVRGDGSLAVIFRISNGHIIELSLGFRPLWHASDLTLLSGAPGAASDPMGYVRGGSIGAVVFRSRGDNHIRQLEFQWTASDLTGP